VDTSSGRKRTSRVAFWHLYWLFLLEGGVGVLIFAFEAGFRLDEIRSGGLVEYKDIKKGVVIITKGRINKNRKGYLRWS
jgi:hypothetical protein